MGMSIEEKAIKTLNEIIDEGWLISDMDKCTAIDACEFAIDRIRKYQKIQKILNSASYVENGTVYSYTYDEDSRIKHIREVIEDGNDD